MMWFSGVNNLLKLRSFGWPNLIGQQLLVSWVEDCDLKTCVLHADRQNPVDNSGHMYAYVPYQILWTWKGSLLKLSILISCDFITSAYDCRCQLCPCRVANAKWSLHTLRLRPLVTAWRQSPHRWFQSWCELTNHSKCQESVHQKRDLKGKPSETAVTQRHFAHWLAINTKLDLVWLPAALAVGLPLLITGRFTSIAVGYLRRKEETRIGDKSHQFHVPKDLVNEHFAMKQSSHSQYISAALSPWWSSHDTFHQVSWPNLIGFPPLHLLLTGQTQSLFTCSQRLS